MKAFIATLLLCLIIFSNTNALAHQQTQSNQSIDAIVSPMPIEAKVLRQAIQHKQIQIIDGVHYLLGTIGTQQVVSVVTGYGKVNVVSIASRLIARFHPALIFLAETSGAVNPKLKIGTVIIANRIFDADFGKLTATGPQLPILIKNPITHKKEPLVFALNSQLQQQVKMRLNKQKFSFPVKFGVIADSDMLPNPPWQIKLLRQNHVQAVAMDGAPIAKLGWLFNINVIVLHSIANIAGKPITAKGTQIAAANVDRVMISLLQNKS